MIPKCSVASYPAPGNCPYPTGMVVHCLTTSTFYFINNTMAIPYSPSSYLSAGMYLRDVELLRFNTCMYTFFTHNFVFIPCLSIILLVCHLNDPSNRLTYFDKAAPVIFFLCKPAGSPLPSFTISQCCSTVVDGCGVPNDSTLASVPPLIAFIPGAGNGYTYITWNSIASTNTLVLQVNVNHAH